MLLVWYLKTFRLFYEDLFVELAVKIGIVDIKSEDVLSLKCCKHEYDMHCLKAYDEREDLVEVNTFNLRETLGYKSSLFLTIRFDVENSVVFNDLLAFWRVNQLKDFTSAEGL